MGLGFAIIAVCAVATVATGGACGFAYAIASNALKGAIWGAVQGAIDGVGSGALQFAKSPNSFCFIGGTIVLTSKGYKAIEEIRIGDKVLATDPETGDTTEKTVLQTFERQTTEFVDVTIGGETYTTTPEHPFYVEGKDFVNASELEVGDKVVCYDTETDTTETKEVEEVYSYETDEPVTVYNFEVHEYHTYHVGEDGVLVHNDCKKPGGNGSGGGSSTSGGGTGGNTVNAPVSTKPNQVHHFATNKSKTYTQQFNNITSKYGLDLDDAWNKELLPHQGRHPNAYHDFVLDGMRNIDNVANGNPNVFLELFESEIKDVIRGNPDMLYSKYWKGLK